MKPPVESVMKVVDLFMEMIPFFPDSLAARFAICEEIHSFVGNEEQLAWFSIAYRQKCGAKWQGQPMLRAVFCLKYRPADGVQATVEVPGHTEPDLIAQHQQRVLEENARRLEEFERLKTIAPPEEDVQSFPLPDVKRIN